APPSPAGGRVAQDDVAPRLEQRARHALRPQRVQGAIEDIPLRNASQIYAHPRRIESYRAGDGVEMDFVRPHTPGRRIELGARWRRPARTGRSAPPRPCVARRTGGARPAPAPAGRIAPPP